MSQQIRTLRFLPDGNLNPVSEQSARSKTSPSKIISSSKETIAGVKTLATIADFVAYNGDVPPWN